LKNPNETKAALGCAFSMSIGARYWRWMWRLC
jgi:hypothetical protein